MGVKVAMNATVSIDNQGAAARVTVQAKLANQVARVEHAAAPGQSEVTLQVPVTAPGTYPWEVTLFSQGRAVDVEQGFATVRSAQAPGPGPGPSPGPTPGSGPAPRPPAAPGPRSPAPRPGQPLPGVRLPGRAAEPPPLLLGGLAAAGVVLFLVWRGRNVD